MSESTLRASVQSMARVRIACSRCRRPRIPSHGDELAAQGLDCLLFGPSEGEACRTCWRIIAARLFR